MTTRNEFGRTRGGGYFGDNMFMNAATIHRWLHEGDVKGATGMAEDCGVYGGENLYGVFPLTDEQKQYIKDMIASHYPSDHQF